jgi:hypothetical protein
MNAPPMMIRLISHGWIVQLSDGRELAGFHGPGAGWRASRYLRRRREPEQARRLSYLSGPVLASPPLPLWTFSRPE